MPEVWDGGVPSPTDPLLASGGESEVALIVIGAYKFPTTDSRDDVGFLGSLPLSPRTKSNQLPPLSLQPWNLSSRRTCRPRRSRRSVARCRGRFCCPGSRR